MNHLSFSCSAIALLLISGVLAVTGCTESSVEPDEHEEPVGIVLSVDGTELFRQIGDSTLTLDTLQVDSLSPLFDVRFVDAAGATFEPHADEGFSLSVHIADTTVVALSKPIDSGLWSVQLAGRRIGSTSLQISLDHGGHADFVSGDLDIEVVE